MNITIVGGGTAGWLTALTLATCRPQHTYTVIESSQIGPIGVGEAATGQLNVLLQKIGINEFDFLLNTNALPKHSLRFVNWDKNFTTFDSPLEYSITRHEYLDTSLFYQILTNQPIGLSSISGNFTYYNKTMFNKKLENIN